LLNLSPKKKEKRKIHLYKEPEHERTLILQIKTTERLLYRPKREPGTAFLAAKKM